MNEKYEKLDAFLNEIVGDMGEEETVDDLDLNDEDYIDPIVDIIREILEEKFKKEL